jgi:D-lactate dehydrogenase
MAYTIFYDTTTQDKTQLSEFLGDTDHHLEHIEESLSLDNVNPEAEVISVFVSSKVTREMIEKMPRLRLIACRSTGFNNVDLHAANERDITVVNAPSYGNHTVAEYAFTLLLALSRKLLPTLSGVEKGQLNQEDFRGFDLYQKTFGLIGSGRIGQSSATLAKAFGMKVIAYDPFPNHDAAASIGFTYREFHDLLRESDVISIHAPLTDSNRHIMNAEAFHMMKPSAVLINTARGELIDTQALIDALQQSEIAGAALDVLEGEKLLNIEEEILLLRKHQLPPDTLQQSLQLSVLEKLPNVIITPHNAFNTYEAVRRINETTARNIAQYWYGETPNKIQLTPPKPGKLIVVRHTESEWNALGKWTGTTDVHLSEKGFKQAAQMGRELKDIRFDYAYCSEQIRTFETMEGILNASQQFDVTYERVSPINERDYGDYTGLNKWDVQKDVGEEQFNRIRREWECPVPNGETLKDVYERVLPFYVDVVLPRLKKGENVLLVGHGNSIRALMKYIENISDEDIAKTEMIFGSALVYDVDENGLQKSKDIISIETTPTPA